MRRDRCRPGPPANDTTSETATGYDGPPVIGRIEPAEVPTRADDAADAVARAVVRLLHRLAESPWEVHVYHHGAGPVTGVSLQPRGGGSRMGGGGRTDYMTLPLASPGAERHGGTGMDAFSFPQPPRSPIDEAIDGWRADMRRRGCAPGSIKRFANYAARCAEHAKWRDVSQIDYAGAAAWLAAMREEGWGGTTHDQAASALRVWGRWLQKSKLTPENPLEHLEGSGEQGDDGSRALTTDEARAMIRVALERQEKDARARGNRALFWAFLCLTGLRTSEAEKCRWGDLDLDAERPTLTSDPAWAKNGKRQTIPLNDEIASLLRRHRQTVPSTRTDRVFPVVPNRLSWRTIRELAGVAAEDARGRAATPHSCRKWLATELDRTGASPGVVSRVLRHSSTLAESRYIDPDMSAEVSAVQALPRLWPIGSDGYIVKIAESAPENGPKLLHQAPKSDTLPPASPSDSPDSEVTMPCTASQSARTSRPGDTGSDSLPDRRNLPGRELPADQATVHQDVVTGSFESSPISESGNGQGRAENHGRTQLVAGHAPAGVEDRPVERGWGTDGGTVTVSFSGPPGAIEDLLRRLMPGRSA